MKCLRQVRWCFALCAAGRFLIFPLAAADVGNPPAPVKSFSVATNLLTPPLPMAHSPVDFFRQLLSMSPRDRENFLTNKPPEVRERLLAKVREYQALDPNERELRLRATELRWYLMPFLRESPTNHAARLAQMPGDIRSLIKARLMQWDILPPPLQREFLENERALHYFSRVDATNSPDRQWHHEPNDSEQAHWNALSENERRALTNRFNQFFELTALEKQKTLNTLSDAERVQMEKTLQSFDELPAAQRIQCVHAFTKFAGMNPLERSEFLKNAERWSQMAPKERQTWRDLVTHVPQWPPLPQALMPPKIQPRLHPAVATNEG